MKKRFWNDRLPGIIRDSRIAVVDTDIPLDTATRRDRAFGCIIQPSGDFEETTGRVLSRRSHFREGAVVIEVPGDCLLVSPGQKLHAENRLIRAADLQQGQLIVARGLTVAEILSVRYLPVVFPVSVMVTDIGSFFAQDLLMAC